MLLASSHCPDVRGRDVLMASPGWDKLESGQLGDSLWHASGADKSPRLV